MKPRNRIAGPQSASTMKHLFGRQPRRTSFAIVARPSDATWFLVIRLGQIYKRHFC